MDNDEAGTSADQNVDDGEEIFEMQDILKNQDEMMEQVAAVLGAGDDFNCTYNQGYVNRQALYACLTCIPEAKDDFTKSAGVCLACSYHCHDGHNMVELYTKRYFRCDCGNKKFTDSPCNLQREKDDLNELNKYNQNFSGLYCTCKKPFPDPEDPIQDDMIQCIICEDWYHSRHLDQPTPANYDEMICMNCVTDNEFLLHYEGSTVTSIVQTDGLANVNIESVNGGTVNTDEVINLDEGVNVDEAIDVDEADKVNGEEENKEPKVDTCLKPKTKSETISTKFMADVSWRQRLCKCEDCMKIYEEKDLMFLLDPQDTVQCYEEKGKEKVKQLNEQALEKEQKYLNSLDRVPLMEAIAGYNEFKDELMLYLKKFSENKKVIRVEDIEEFFSDLKARKKQKTEIPYFCR